MTIPTKLVYGVEFWSMQPGTIRRSVDLSLLVDLSDPDVQDKICTALNVGRTKTFVNPNDLRLQGHSIPSAQITYDRMSKTLAFSCRVFASSRDEAIQRAYLYYPSTQWARRTRQLNWEPKIVPLTSLKAKVSKVSKGNEGVYYPNGRHRQEIIDRVKVNTQVKSFANNNMNVFSGQHDAHAYCKNGLFIFDWSKYTPEEIEIQTALGHLNSLYRTCPMKINEELLHELGLTIADCGPDIKDALEKVNTLPK